MQIELSLLASPDAGYSARDLGFLLHKHPDHLHEREVATGKASIFFPEREAARTTAVLHLALEPVGLVRGKNRQSEGLLAQYVNDRPYVANSFLSVALGRSFGQTMAGKSKERQALADRALPFEVRIVPVAVSGGEEIVRQVFEPLGYRVASETLNADGVRSIHDLRLSGVIRLRDLLSHLYVLVPVLDNAKHYWIDRTEVEKLLDKAGDWLAAHPAKELITLRAMKHRRALANLALARLSEVVAEEPADDGDPPEQPEDALEQPIRLHDLRLDTVAQTLREAGATRVLDLGCGEGKLLGRLIKEGGITHVCGVDPSIHALEKAARRLRLDQAGEAMRERVTLQMGSLTYGDRRWHGFDAATLVEVIEHVDPHRLSALVLSLFADARPSMVVMTTPNREYNVLFEGLKNGKLRHPDHRFEWTRPEFESWANTVAEEHGYNVSFAPVGPVDGTHGSPSQMAVFKQEAAA